MPTERFTFPGHGGQDLAARLDLPDGPHLATALFAHCFTCSKDIPAARRIAGRLASMGIAVLRFDFTGLGHSDGEFENTNFTTNVQDLVATSAELERRGMAPSLLIGHSLGDAAVLMAASDITSIKAVVTIGAPFDPEHVTHNFADALPRIIRDGVAEVSLGGRPFRISNDFLEDVAKGQLTPTISNLNAALLVLHAPRDATVSIDNASEIFLAAKHPKSFITLDDADHFLTRVQDAEYAADVIATWATLYLDMKRPAPPIGIPEGVLRVSEADASGFLQDIQSGPHHVLADEPAAYGRHQQGPDALRVPVCGAWGVYQYDHSHVCAPQGLAAGSRQRRCHPRQSPWARRGIRSHIKNRQLCAHYHADRGSGCRPARASAGNRGSLPCASIAGTLKPY